jgi:predicted transcriptional regulator
MNALTKHTMSTGLVTINCQDSLEEAYEKMKEYRIRHLLVIDDSDDVVGIISDRDLQRAKWPLFKSKDALSEPFFREGDCVESYMSWPIKSVSHETDLSKVVEIMVNEKISAVVVTIGETSAGIVTHEDLLKLLSKFLKPPSSSPKERLEAWAYNSPIGRVMTALADSGI